MLELLTILTSCSPNNNNWSQTVLGSLLQIMKTINVSYQASRLCQTISNSMSSVLSLTLYYRYYRDMQNVFSDDSSNDLQAFLKVTKLGM